MDTIVLVIDKWEKYQPRRDLKTMHWFRIQAKIIHDRHIRKLSYEHRWLFISILSLCAENNCGKLETDVDELCHVSGLKNAQVLSGIDKLSESLLRNESVRKRSLHNNTIQNNTEHTLSKERVGFSISEIWNANCGKLPKVKQLSARRRKAANALLKNNSDEKYWVDIVQRIARSKFCNGENNRNWQASFDFLLRPDTHIKASEGQYDNRGDNTFDFDAYMQRVKDMK